MGDCLFVWRLLCGLLVQLVDRSTRNLEDTGLIPSQASGLVDNTVRIQKMHV